MSKHFKDGGYASRKFWFACGTSFLIFIGAILSGVWSLLGVHYEAMISGLIGVLTLYLGGNIGAKMAIGNVITKSGRNLDDDDPPPRPTEPPVPPKVTHKID